MDNHPQAWAAVQTEIRQAMAGGDVAALKGLLDRSAAQAMHAVGGMQKNPANRQLRDAALLCVVKTRMIELALRNHALRTATGVQHGTVRFNYFNGWIAQKLLFAHDLQRKPVNLFWFRLLWPLVWQKRFLMPLVQPKGIYCFYARPLIAALAKSMAGRTCLEIAAGDGTLSRFLQDAGVAITATDDHSWQHAVDYPGQVVRLDARAALQQYQPDIVLCSWPPADNAFERQVFVTDSVQTYIVIGSRHRFAAGNWQDYQSQTTFAFSEDPELSRLVLPPELDAAVYVFRRKPAAADHASTTT